MSTDPQNMETPITDHMLEVLRRLVQQKQLMSEVRFKIIRDPRSRHEQTTVQCQVFIDGKERGGYGANVPDSAIPQGVQQELHRFMHMLTQNLSKLGID